MSYTESQLNGKNKGQVVAIALALTSQLDAINSGPVTSDVVKAKMLELKRQSVDIADKRKEEINRHAEAIATIKAESERHIAELELKYLSEDGVDGKAITQQYAELQKNAIKGISDLSFGLEKAEHETKIKLEKLAEQTTAANEKFTELEAKLAEDTRNIRNAHVREIKSMETAQARKIEQIIYDNAIAVRDKNKEFADKVTKTLGLELVEATSYRELKETKEADAKEVKSQIEEAVKAAEAKLYRTEGSKFNQLKNASENRIALLENDNEHIESNLLVANTRIKDLESKLALVPTQIKEAVAASKAAISVNQDVGKK